MKQTHSAKIPLRISPFFFLTAGIIGYILARDFIGTLLCIGVIFISILVHEYGHALVSRMFGQSPKIELTAFGGVTYATLPRLSLPKEFLVVLAGPVFGFTLFLIGLAIQATGFFTGTTAQFALQVLIFVNLYWTILNLIPILPLDGGQLLRIVLEGIFGYKGRSGAFIASMVVSVTLGLIFIFFGNIIFSLIFFLFAFQNFEFYRQLRNSTREDENEDLKHSLAQAEAFAREQKYDEALTLLDEVRAKSKAGLIFSLATVDLAKLKMIQENYQEAYDLLQPLTSSLSDTGRAMLHHAAFEVKDYKTVLALAGNCFVNMPDGNLVLRSAAAAASLGDLSAAMGWLETAKDFGCENIKEYTDHELFDPIRFQPTFQDFLKEL